MHLSARLVVTDETSDAMHAYEQRLRAEGVPIDEVTRLRAAVWPLGAVARRRVACIGRTDAGRRARAVEVVASASDIFDRLVRLADDQVPPAAPQSLAARHGECPTGSRPHSPAPCADRDCPPASLPRGAPVTSTFALVLPACLRARISRLQAPDTRDGPVSSRSAGPTALLLEPASNAEGPGALSSSPVPDPARVISTGYDGRAARSAAGRRRPPLLVLLRLAIVQ